MCIRDRCRPMFRLCVTTFLLALQLLEDLWGLHPSVQRMSLLTFIIFRNVTTSWPIAITYLSFALRSPSYRFVRRVPLHPFCPYAPTIVVSRITEFDSVLFLCHLLSCIDTPLSLFFAYRSIFFRDLTNKHSYTLFLIYCHRIYLWPLLTHKWLWICVVYISWFY